MPLRVAGAVRSVRASAAYSTTPLTCARRLGRGRPVAGAPCAQGSHALGARTAGRGRGPRPCGQSPSSHTQPARERNRAVRRPRRLNARQCLERQPWTHRLLNLNLLVLRRHRLPRLPRLPHRLEHREWRSVGAARRRGAGVRRFVGGHSGGERGVVLLLHGRLLSPLPLLQGLLLAPTQRLCNVIAPLRRQAPAKRLWPCMGSTMSMRPHINGYVRLKSPLLGMPFCQRRTQGTH